MASPTPWTIVKAPKEYLRPLADDFSILDANGDEIAEQTEFYPTMLGEEDTALAVRAVNSHADMLEALAQVRETLRNLSSLRAPIDEHIAATITKNALSRIDAAIAKAKGGAA